MTMSDEELKDHIQDYVDTPYEKEGVHAVRVDLIQRILKQQYDQDLTWNGVMVACDELVHEGRLEFVRDTDQGGRRYASTNVDPEKLRLLREQDEM